ncbi:hypothetical protein D8I24_0024 (plasmid) [Cupriavidus necator H850]|uniref:DUF5677 domain-containing protein n=1 Tax=Cupriavidus necator TaxID=106590 RepID=UPI00129D7B6F|nr:DUF5677 domain-containing protein [Cupriavidus necator]KAI3611866.1 hypothetical protein D8I24_0024 [Cupriavidus necator H850]
MRFPIDNITATAPTDDWFILAQDTLVALEAAADDGMQRTRGAVNWAPAAVAVRLLLRACDNLAAVSLLTERGLVAEGRTLARSLIENSFAVAALHRKPGEYVEQLKADSERSRRNQAEFILHSMPDSEADRSRLRQPVERIDKSLKLISQKALALDGPLKDQYLGYQRLSDDAAHVTARSLQRHVQLTEGGWHYRRQAGTEEENAATLHYAVMAALGVGIGVTEYLKADGCNAAFAPLCDRFRALPPVATI